MRTDDTTHFLRHANSAVAATIVILLIFSTNVQALSCKPRIFTLSEAYEAADSIIVGLITECAEAISSDSWAGGGSGCSFVSMDVLKESKPAREYRGVTSSSGCGLSLIVGNQYLLFLDSESKPLHYSASLSGEPNSTLVSSNHERILREFRNGVVQDLSGPWFFREHENACSISHSVGGHQFTFNSAKADAPESSKQDWTRETVDGKTIIRGSARSGGANSTSPMQDVEVVLVGDLPEYPIGAPMLSISFLESQPAPARQAALTVGSQNWSLYRVEQSFSLGGMPVNTRVSYQVGGDIAEQILSAMSKPSDISVSAVLIDSPNTDSESQPETSQLDQGAVFQAEPQKGLTKPTISPSVGGPRTYQVLREPPEPILRLETRSTQLPAAAESFQACYEGAER